MQTSTVSTDNLLVWSEQFNLFNLITPWTVDGKAVEEYDNWCNTAEIQCVQFLNVYMYIYFYMYRVYTWYYVTDTWHVHVFTVYAWLSEMYKYLI